MAAPLAACLLAASALLSAVESEATHVLWTAPLDIERRDLFWGPGGADGAPVAPFRFVRERTNGTQPKFEVEDARGAEWIVKLGPEAQAETVASRLVWAAGYFAEAHYYAADVRIDGMRPLQRGAPGAIAGNVVRGARFQAEDDSLKSEGRWSWTDNPFVGTRELNGLKVLMMLLNNWDPREDNNRVLRTRGDRREHRYLVTDLGATFGRVGSKWEYSKNDIHDYERSPFVAGVDDGTARFHYSVWPKRLGLFALLYPPYVVRLCDVSRAMRDVPAADAVWVGSLLGRLSDAQLDAAFRAADYDRETRARYVAAVRGRIGELQHLAR